MDNYVQDPSNTQNYNRYGYVLNNPLKYTDPSGWTAESEKAQRDEEERLKREYALAYSQWYGQQLGVGADGLTTQQWASLGGQGVNSPIYNNYVKQNRDAYIAQLNDVMLDVANNIAFKKDLLSRFNKIDPYAEAPKNVNSLIALLNDLEGLGAFHDASGKYELKYGGKSNEYRGYTVDETKTHIFYDDAFDSYYKLASTMFHEIYHAFQHNYRNGMMYDALANAGYKTGYMYVSGMAIPNIGDFFIAVVFCK